MRQKPKIIYRGREKLARAWLLGSKQSYQRVASIIGYERPAKNVVYVAGAQRSGTNMVMDMLEGSLQTEVLHERDPRAFERFELRDERALRAIITSSRARTVVFKALCESQYLTRLLDGYSASRAVWVYRNYEAVVRSHVRLWTGMPETMRLIATDPQATHGWRGRGMTEETRRFIRECYHTSISNESACALFWYMRNVLYFEQALDRSDDTYLLCYDQLVHSPKANAEKLFQFLELKFRPAMCDFVSPTKSTTNPRSDLGIDPRIRTACDDLSAKLQLVDDSVA